MPKNDEGEFELILGNRQLISVFLIVVILLGVFFSMGYIVGRNSASAIPAETARNDKAAPASDAQPDTAAPTADSSTPPEAAPAPSQATPAPSAPTTQPEQAPKPARAEKTPEHSAQEPKPKPAPAPPPAATAAPERAAVTGQPSAGDYWQVVATARPDAEIIAETISKRGFHAILSPAPKEGVFRVLVGPLPDVATQAKTRTELEAAGFKNPILRKY
ncbi:MAG TPA: hypothetical protein VMB25_21300 [Bryobacteraceae bacterium]|nr:hypothetical protein [Bryobacteraceae bacterium]